MTALKPIENSRVIGVASEAYPSNLICAHPECTEEVQLRPDGTPTVHHVFASSKIKSRSYFVGIEVTAATYACTPWMRKFSTTVEGLPPYKDAIRIIVPHAVGLCGSGTTGHHGDVEEHHAWIKLEDGEYVWYEENHAWSADEGVERWRLIGPLSPQPGSRDGKPKRKKQAKSTEEKRTSVSTTIRAPVGESNMIPELLEQAKEAYKQDAYLDRKVYDYEVSIAALVEFVENHPLKKKRKK